MKKSSLDFRRPRSNGRDMCHHSAHASAAGGVCPYCLRDRLLLLCPDCANVRPCARYASPCLFSSPAGSCSSSSSSELAASRLGKSTSAGDGGQQPPATKEEGEKWIAPGSRSVGDAGGDGCQDCCLEWLKWPFFTAARAFWANGRWPTDQAAKVDKEMQQPLRLYGDVEARPH